jgi:hypothetical protein
VRATPGAMSSPQSCRDVYAPLAPSQCAPPTCPEDRWSQKAEPGDCNTPRFRPRPRAQTSAIEEETGCIKTGKANSSAPTLPTRLGSDGCGESNCVSLRTELRLSLRRVSVPLYTLSYFFAESADRYDALATAPGVSLPVHWPACGRRWSC